MSTPVLLTIRPRAQTCKTCGSELPLVAEAPENELRDWLCAICGEPCRAALYSDYQIESLRNIRPACIDFDRNHLKYPTPEMLEYARSLTNFDVKGTEKRSAHRHAVVIPVLAQPLDEMFLPNAPPIVTASRNLSTTDSAKVKVAVRIKCSDAASEAGW